MVHTNKNFAELQQKDRWGGELLSAQKNRGRHQIHGTGWESCATPVTWVVCSYWTLTLTPTPPSNGAPPWTAYSPAPTTSERP